MIAENPSRETAECPYNSLPRKRGRAVECTGLENRQRRKAFVSSNLTASAKPIGNFDHQVAQTVDIRPEGG